jgi:glycosyltransferase involved in cell wall biosynthesis
MSAPEQAGVTAPGAPGDRPLRVLQVSEFYPPVIGGMERHVERLAGGLAARGHEVVVAVPSPSRSRVETAGGVALHHLAMTSGPVLRRLSSDPGRVFHPPAPDPGLVARLQALVHRFRPDVVHVHGWVLGSVLAVPDLGGARLVVTLHDHCTTCANRVYLRDGAVCDGPGVLRCTRCNAGEYGLARSAAVAVGLRALRPLQRRVDGVIAVSSAVAATGASTPAAHGALVEVIPGFVADVPEADRLARPAFLPGEDGYVLFVGALGLHKGVGVLLDAQRRGLGAPLVLLGTPTGTTPPSFPGDVTVVRDVGHDDVMAAWARCSVAVAPSLCVEAFGLVALEAMAMGKPVVASAIGGLVDIVVPGETGVLVPPGDAAALAGAVAALVADPARARRLGEAGRARSQLFRADRMLERTEAFYRRLLRGAGDDDGAPQPAATHPSDLQAQ